MIAYKHIIRIILNHSKLFGYVNRTTWNYTGDTHDFISLDYPPVPLAAVPHLLDMPDRRMPTESVAGETAQSNEGRPMTPTFTKGPWSGEQCSR